MARTELPDREFDLWSGVELPEHIDPDNIERLTEVIADKILQDAVVLQALDLCNLDPTTRAARLAAHAAVIVLLAHELGQEVAADFESIHGDETEGGYQP